MFLKNKIACVKVSGWEGIIYNEWEEGQCGWSTVNERELGSEIGKNGKLFLVLKSITCT